MKIKIKNTGEIRELEFLDGRNNDCTEEFLASTGAVYDYDSGTGVYHTDLATFQLWETISKTLAKINKRNQTPPEITDQYYEVHSQVQEKPASMRPTDEQLRILEIFKHNDGDLKINAYAGTGKTTTLRLIAEQHPDQTFLYLAFNKALQTEASEVFPDNVKCMTTHGLAYRSLKIYKSSWQSRLRREPPEVYQNALNLKGSPFGMISTGNFIAAIRETVNSFCCSAADKPEQSHIPFWIYKEHPQQKIEIMAEVLRHARILWCYMADPEHTVPVTHDFYLKYWQLKNPVLRRYDCLLFDEAQDASPVTLKIVSSQRNARKIYVGDRHQQIYSWRGAVNAMDKISCQSSAELTQSFRFGEVIAEAAKKILGLKAAYPEIRGYPKIYSELKKAERKLPFTVICRTNTGIIEEALTWADKRRKISVVGGLEEPLRKIKSAYFLYIKKTQYITDPEIKGYSSWESLKEASKLNDQFEIKRIVTFINKYKRTVPDILERLETWASFAEEDSSVILTTGHKSKGREWGQVVIGEDFTDPFVRDDDDDGPELFDTEEINLLYVAATRAQHILEIPSLISKKIFAVMQETEKDS